MSERDAMLAGLTAMSAFIAWVVRWLLRDLSRLVNRLVTAVERLAVENGRAHNEMAFAQRAAERERKGKRW